MAIRRAVARALEWEDWLTLGLAYLCFLSVAWSIQKAHWADTMPSLLLLGLGGLIAGWILGRSSLPWPIALMTAAVWGLLATFLQSLYLVPEGSLGERIDSLYLRFQDYFHVVLSGGISNDALPFVVLVAGLTWGGAFFLAWGLFRWHTAWLGLLAGGITLLINFVLLNRGVLGAFILFAITGLLLLARAHILGKEQSWRREGLEYPPLLSPAHLHLSFWAALVLLMAAWIVPTGYGRPLAHTWEAVSGPFRSLASDWVRWVGPLKGKKLIEAVDIASVLPLRPGLYFASSGEVLAIRLPEGSKPTYLLLRAAVYEEYASGGWKAGERVGVRWPFATLRAPTELLAEPLRVEVQLLQGGTPSSVLLVPGQALPMAFTSGNAALPATALAPKGAVVSLSWADSTAPSHPLMSIPQDASDEDIRRALLREGYLALEIKRQGRWAREISAVPVEAILQATIVPEKKLSVGESYWTAGILPLPSLADLQAAGTDYPAWIQQVYLSLPKRIPSRMKELAREVAGDKPTPVDKVLAIANFLRTYPTVSESPVPTAGDLVDHFLFEARRGRVELRASAMVVLLRAAGVPARLAAGIALAPRDYDENQKAYRVTANQVLAWPEVYFPRWGWVPFLITEGEEALNLPYQYGLPVPAGLFGPLGPEDTLLQEILEGTDLPTEGQLPEGLTAGPQEGEGGAIWWWVALGMMASLLIGVGVARWLWERPLAHLPTPQPIWEKTVRLASWAGIGPRAGETPHDFARRLATTLRGISDLTPLADAYCLSRYGRRSPPPETVSYLNRLWPHLRGAILSYALRRFWRRETPC